MLRLQPGVEGARHGSCSLTLGGREGARGDAASKDGRRTGAGERGEGAAMRHLVQVQRWKGRRASLGKKEELFDC